MTTKHMLALALVAAAIVASEATAAAQPNGLSTARAATAGYHNNDAALAAGYGEFRDAQGIACIDKPGVGGMGVHFVKDALVGDAVVNAATLEALVYEPTPNGRIVSSRRSTSCSKPPGTRYTARRRRCSASSST
jgi:hypothetical protein